MTEQQRYEEMLKEAAAMRSALRHVKTFIAAYCHSSDIGPTAQAEEDALLASVDECLKSDGKWEKTPLTSPRPFEHQQFFAGFLDAIDYLAGVARETQLAGVWRALFDSMRVNVLEKAEKKGYTFK